MGKSISYCYKCSTLLREDDFEKGKAFQDGDRVVCIKCAPQLRGTRVTKKSTTVLKTATTSRKIPTVPAQAPPVAPPAVRSRLPMILGACGGVVAVLAVILVLVFSRRNEPAPPLPAEVPPPVEVKKEKQRAPVVVTPEQELLKAARKFAAEHADDLGGQIKEYEKVVWEFERTPSATEAKKEIETIKATVAEKVNAELAKVEKEIEELLKREAFGQATKALEDAGGRLAVTDWSLALAKRSRQIFDQARGMNADLVAKVESLATEGKTKEIQEIVRRVRGWEIATLIAKIEEAAGPALTAKAEDTAKPVPGSPTAAVPVETKPRSEEGKAYLGRWEQAMAKVAARDYAGALDDLARAGAALKEADSAAESKADVEDVKALQALVKGAIEETVAKPPGWMSVELRDGRKLAGRVLGVDADRAELGSKEIAFAEWSEATAGSIAALPRKQKPEPRLLALFCLSEGETESAKALLGATLDAVAPKYWAWAPAAKGRIPRAEGLELSARELFYSAEREYRSIKTRGLAADKYKSLRKDYLAAPVVKRAIDRIERRSDACREYYFAPADFEREGSLKLTKAGKLESDADSDANFANQNWAEFEFYVLPGATYRAWILAGGCCQEVLGFLWQGSELMETSPKTKKPDSADIGARLAAFAKVSGIRGLKPTHDPKTPKAPTRWEWLELPLPKYSGPGPKRVRIMTDQKGFSIGAVVVSSTRKGPPKDDELKELDKARAAEAPAVRVDPDLVAWFTLDEGAGAAVEDVAGGHKGTIVGKASWITGRLGGALDLDGQTHVTVGDAEDLRLVGDITMAFWLNKKAAGGDWQRMVGKGDERLRSYGCWVGGGNEKVLFQQYSDAAQAVVSFTTQKDVQIGKWHHFGATVQGTRVVLYLDGVMDSEGIRTGTPAKSSEPLLLGWGTIHAKFTGSLDDVRIYKRALAPEEIRGLFEMGR
jgi:hypothetical protein